MRVCTRHQRPRLRRHPHGGDARPRCGPTTGCAPPTWARPTTLRRAEPRHAGRGRARRGRRRRPGRSMAEAPVLELRRVHAAYGQIEVLHGIDLAVANGAVLALLGPNGAGKSTTLRVASGQMEPTKGCFHVLGPPRQRHAARQAGPGRAVHAARRPRHLPQPDRHREPPPHDLRRPVAVARGGDGLRPLPPAEGAAAPGRRHPLGRRAADAGHGPHAQRGARRPAARRDLHGPGAR